MRLPRFETEIHGGEILAIGRHPGRDVPDQLTVKALEHRFGPLGSNPVGAEQRPEAAARFPSTHLGGVEIDVERVPTGALLFDVRPFDAFTGDVFVAAGDVTGEMETRTW